MRYHLTPGRKAIIKKSINNKCWRGCGEQGMFLHCWWECKLVQPLWRTVWKSLKKLKTDIIWPCNPTPGQKSREKHDLKGYVDPMFTAALFTVAKTWKQPKCPSAEEWIKEMWCRCTVEYPCVCAKSLQYVWHFVILGTVAWHPLSMGLSRQEYWSGLPCPSPGDLPDCSLPRRTSQQVFPERQRSASLLKF